MIFQNKLVLPLTKLKDDLFRCILGDYTLFITDVSLISNSTDYKSNTPNRISNEYQLDLPCKARIELFENDDKRCTIVPDDNFVLCVAEQTQVISNADGTVGKWDADPKSLKVQSFIYTFKNANSYNTNVINDLKGILIACEFDEEPDTIRHLIYSTLTSKYGAVISADDEIGTGSVLEKASVVDSPVIRTISGLVDYGGIVELPNISTVLGIKRKVWHTNAEYAMIFNNAFEINSDNPEATLERDGHRLSIRCDSAVSIDTNGIGFFTSLWDKINCFDIDADDMSYAITFDKRTYSVYTDCWTPIISCDPEIHGGEQYTWHLMLDDQWYNTEELTFDPKFVTQALDDMDHKPKLSVLNTLSADEINSTNGFVMRESSYVDIVFYVENTQLAVIRSFKIIVNETGYSEATLGENGSYDIIRKHDKGRQLHTIVKKGVGVESIIIDYI